MRLLQTGIFPSSPYHHYRSIVVDIYCHEQLRIRITDLMFPLYQEG